MTDDDVIWAAQLMERRRRTYAQYSPVFWRPRADVVAQHATFLRTVIRGKASIAVRSESGFLIAVPQAGRYFVDDFAVDSDRDWARDGATLVAAARARATRLTPAIRIVTARRDRCKRAMLRSLGLSVGERWWVRELRPSGSGTPLGPVHLGETPCALLAAPPVYDPGGPVCFIRDNPLTDVEELCRQAARLGAVLLVISRSGANGPLHESEPELEAAGFHNPSEFFEGRPDLAVASS